MNINQILSLTQSDIPVPQGTTRQGGDYLGNLQKQAKVKEYEHQIDLMVYKLYDLTEEEIKIVEGEIYGKK